MSRTIPLIANYLKTGDRVFTDKHSGIITSVYRGPRSDDMPTPFVFAWMQCDKPNEECFIALSGYPGGHSHPISAPADSLLMVRR